MVDAHSDSSGGKGGGGVHGDAGHGVGDKEGAALHAQGGSGLVGSHHASLLQSQDALVLAARELHSHLSSPRGGNRSDAAWKKFRDGVGIGKRQCGTLPERVKCFQRRCRKRYKTVWETARDGGKISEAVWKTLREGGKLSEGMRNVQRR